MGAPPTEALRPVEVPLPSALLPPDAPLLRMAVTPPDAVSPLELVPPAVSAPPRLSSPPAVLEARDESDPPHPAGSGHVHSKVQTKSGGTLCSANDIVCDSHCVMVADHCLMITKLYGLQNTTQPADVPTSCVVTGESCA